MKLHWVLLVALMGGATAVCAEEVRICKQSDGRLSIVYWAGADHTTPPDLIGLPCEDRDSSELPDRSRRDAWRKQPDGSIKADPTIETDAERRSRVQQAAAQATRAKLGLTPKEFEDLREALR